MTISTAWYKLTLFTVIIRAYFIIRGWWNVAIGFPDSVTEDHVFWINVFALIRTNECTSTITVGVATHTAKTSTILIRHLHHCTRNAVIKFDEKR